MIMLAASSTTASRTACAAPLRSSSAEIRAEDGRQVWQREFRIHMGMVQGWSTVATRAAAAASQPPSPACPPCPNPPRVRAAARSRQHLRRRGKEP